MKLDALKYPWAGAVQPEIKITTATGSFYIIDNGYWNKNNGAWDELMWAHCVDEHPYSSMAELSQSKQLPIQVGKSMYIGGYGFWWVSTPIVRIEELESRILPAQIPAHPKLPLLA
jgi:hypothetical protein